MRDNRVSAFLLICYLSGCSVARFVKKRFGEQDVEAVLHRLDRLTQDEARTTAAEILGVVYGLVQNINVLMDG